MTNETFDRVEAEVQGGDAPRTLSFSSDKNLLQTRATIHKHVFAGTINLTNLEIGNQTYTMIGNETITISTTEKGTFITPGLSGDVGIDGAGIVLENGVSAYLLGGLWQESERITLIEAPRLSLICSLTECDSPH